MTTDADSPLRLAAEFPPATREQWLKLVQGVLKGASFDKRLVTRTFDGLAIEPLYAGDAATHPVPARAPGSPWTILQRIDLPDPVAANIEALRELENGATGLSLTFAGSVGGYGFGLDAAQATIARVLDGVHLDAGIVIDLDAAWPAGDAASAIATLVQRAGLNPSAVNVRFNLDPIGAFAINGGSEQSWDEGARRFASTVGELAHAGFRGPLALADGRVIHNACGTEAQELAFVLSVGVAYLRALEGGGIPLQAAQSLISFKLSADANQFLTIAKFRALRKLWTRVEEACGLARKPTIITAETAWRMMTRRDPWVNMLRTTVATFSAAVGGADAMTVLPFTLALGLPDRFARRIARNTQILLSEESHLAKVADPAAGSGGIEDITAKLCEAAWALFQEFERAGGAWAALQSGAIQEQAARARAERATAVARRKDALTGTSEFPDLHETPVSVLAPSLLVPSVTRRSERSAIALPAMRLAEPFEALRDASDRLLKETGSRPKVFLANLGTLAEFTARATFAKNIFEAGGIEAITNEGFAALVPLPESGRSATQRSGGARPPADPSLDRSQRSDPSLSGEAGQVTRTNLPALTAAFNGSGAKLVCLCSSDQVYAAEAVEAAEALTAAGARHVYLAGRPGELESALRHAGVETFIFVGCDVLATLQAAHDLSLRVVG